MSTSSISELLAHLDPEIWLVTARDEERRGGLAATSVANLSIVPELPRIALAVAKDHFTWQLIEASSAFALHRLAEEQLDWVWRFGLQSGRYVDKLAGLSWREGASGSPILTDALGWLDCRVEAKTDVGDRTLYVGEVIDGALTAQRPALRWQRAAALATPAQLSKLRELRDRQIVPDAQLIRAWRQEHCG